MNSMQTYEKIEKIPPYEQANLIKNTAIWNSIDNITVEEGIRTWLTTLSPLTSLNYNSGMKKLAELGLIIPSSSLQIFALVNHEAIIDRIKLVSDWSEATKQARVACYINFTAFLSRRLEGIVRKAIPNREKGNRTFYKIRDKVKTEALNQSQWLAFLYELEKINSRDCLIAKIILQGGKRVSEVLSLQTDQINWHKNEITFAQSKTRGFAKQIVITYHENVMLELKTYLKNRKGHVFITRFEKPVLHNQLIMTFEKARNAAGIPFKVTPHVLRTSTVTFLKQQGFSDSDIMRVSGHSSSALIYAYDKGLLADNATKKINLIG